MPSLVILCSSISQANAKDSLQTPARNSYNARRLAVWPRRWASMTLSFRQVATKVITATWVATPLRHLLVPFILTVVTMLACALCRSASSVSSSTSIRWLIKRLISSRNSWNGHRRTVCAWSSNCFSRRRTKMAALCSLIRWSSKASREPALLVTARRRASRRHRS